MTTRFCDSSPSIARQRHRSTRFLLAFRVSEACLALAMTLAVLATAGPDTASAVRFSRVDPPDETDAIDDPQPISKSDRMEWGRLMREARDELRRKQFSTAESTLLKALAIADHHGPPDQRAKTTLFYLEKVADAYFAAGRFSDHARVTPEIILRMGSLTDNREAAVRTHRRALAQSFEETNQFESARSLVDSLIEDPSIDDADRTSLLLQRASLSLGANDLARAEEDIDAASIELAASEWIDPEPRLAAQRLRGQLLVRQNKPAEAETAFKETLAEATLHAPASPSAALAQGDLASLYLAQNRSGEALPLARASIQSLEEQRAELHRQVAGLELLAAVLASLGRDQEAQSTFERALHRSANLPDTSASVRERYVTWLRDRGREEDAATVEAAQETAPSNTRESSSLSLPPE